MFKIKFLWPVIVFAIITLVGSYLPFIVSLVAAKLNTVDDKMIPAITLEHLLSNGESIIVCIPMCVSIMYTIYVHKKKGGSSGLPDIFFWFTVLFFILGVVFYVAHILKYDSNKSFVLTFSEIFFGFTVLALLFSKGLEDYNLSLTTSRQNQADSLELKYEKGQIQ